MNARHPLRNPRPPLRVKPAQAKQKRRKLKTEMGPEPCLRFLLCLASCFLFSPYGACGVRNQKNRFVPTAVLICMVRFVPAALTSNNFVHAGSTMPFL